MPEELVDEFSDMLLQEFLDVFRLGFGNDPPVKVEPLKVRLKPDAKPVKCGNRRYAPVHAKFMQKHGSD